METINNLKSRIIKKVKTMDNRDFLEAMDSLIFSNTDDTEIIELSDEQKERIIMAQKDVIMTEEEANNEIEKWLKEK